MRAWQSRSITVAAVLLLISGGLILGLPSWQAAQKRAEGERTNNRSLASTQTVALKDFTLTNPRHLTLPRLGINLDIKQGAYNLSNHTWLLDRTHAFVMPDTKTPIIYGHDIPAVFMHLQGVAANELLYIQQADGTTYVLRYVGDVVVKPTDTSVLSTYAPRSVLLMTCTGSHFENRRVLRFELVGVRDVAMVQGSNHARI